MEDYIQALLSEFRLYRPMLADAAIDTIYLGGGTPSLLGPASLASLLRSLSAGRETGGMEVTMEANPGTLDQAKLDAFVGAGGNRLSLGAQTHDRNLLRLLGRIHTADDTAAAVAMTRAAGIRRISLDLIYGLPGQSPAGWEETIRFALSLDPEHISLYCLEVHAGTPLAARLAAGELDLPGEDDTAGMLAAAMRTLEAAGFRWYEIANFARPGAECRHNLNYWRRGFYLGLGVAAHSFLGGRRWGNLRDLPMYHSALAQGEAPVEFVDEIGPAEEVLEELMLGLRLREGIDRTWFKNRIDQKAAALFDQAREALLAEGLLAAEGARLRLTERGVIMADYVVRSLVAVLPERREVPSS